MQPSPPPQDDELSYWLALNRAPGIGPVAFHRILAELGLPANFTHRLIEKGFTYYGIGVPDSARTE